MQYRGEHRLRVFLEVRDCLRTTVIFRRCWDVSRTPGGLVEIMAGDWSKDRPPAGHIKESIS